MRTRQSASRLTALAAGVLVALPLLWTGCGSTGPDTSPPQTPGGFARIGGGDGENRFGWTKNRESDLAGYRLYRTEDDPANQFVRIAETHRDSTSYTDSNLDYTVTFYYRLTAFDRSDNESPSTNPILAIPANLSAPAPPANANAVAQNLVPPPSITLSWSPNTEGDFKEYWIYRGTLPNVSTSGSAFAVVPKGTTIYEDTSIVVGTRYYYRVVAVDKGNLKSPGSQSQEVSDVALAPPALTSPMPNATANSATPMFQWASVAQAVGYKLYVASDALGRDVIWSRYVQLPTTTITYGGPSLTGGRAYYWQVAATTKGESPINSISELRKFTVP